MALPVRVPPDQQVDQFVAAVRDAGVQLVGLNFAAGDMPAGDRGLVSWPGRQQEFLDSVQVAVGIADQLGVDVFNALYGNRLEASSAQRQDELAAENLTAAAAAARTVGADVLLEPVSGAPHYPLLSAQDAVDVIDRVRRGDGPDNLRLLADLYHLSVNGDDLAAVISQHTPLIGHVQIADAPGRHEPGSGALALDTLLKQLAEGGYAGWVGLEYAPSTTTVAGLQWLPRDRRRVAAATT